VAADKPRLITTLRYVLQNPVRAGLSETVHEWPGSSARRRQLVDRSPSDDEIRWSEQLESRLDELQVATIRECLNRQRPFGQSEWQTEMAVTFGLGSTVRPVRLSYVMDRHSRRTGIACCAWSL